MNKRFFQQVRFVVPIGAVALCAATTLSVVGLSGCGGGGAATRATNALTNTETEILANDGVVGISVPTLPADVTRVLPDKGRFLKIEIFDLQAPLAGATTGTPTRIALPIELADGTTAPNGTFYVLDRKPYTDAATGVPPARTAQFARLPVKNLVIRVAAYAFDPADPKITQNPVLAQAEVSFKPERKKPDGTGGANLSFTLDTNISELAISGSDAIEQPTTASGTFTLNARVGNDIALLPVDSVLAARNVSWTYSLVQGSGSATKPDASEILTATNALSNALSATLNAKPFADGKGVKYGTVRLTATDAESGLTATKDVRIAPQPATLDLSLTNPPFGTRSVRVTVDPIDDTLAPNTEVVRLFESEKPFEPAKSDSVLTNVFAGQSFPAGTAQVSVDYYSGESADGALLYSTKSPEDLFFAPKLTTKRDVSTTGKGLSLSVFVIDGAKRNADGSLSPIDGSFALTSDSTTTPALVAGTSYKIQVRAETFRYPVTAFSLQSVKINKDGKTEPFGTVVTLPNFTDRYELRLPSSSSSQTCGLILTESRNGGGTAPTPPTASPVYQFRVVRDTAQAVLKVK